MELATEIEIIKSKVSYHESSLDKLTDIALSLKEIAIEHKTKIFILQEENRDLKNTTERIADKLKIDTENIAKTLKEDNIELFKNFKSDLKEDLTELKTAFTTVGIRITSLEKYRWLLVGGIGISAFVIGLAIEYITGTKIIHM